MPTENNMESESIEDVLKFCEDLREYRGEKGYLRED